MNTIRAQVCIKIPEKKDHTGEATQSSKKVHRLGDQRDLILLLILYTCVLGKSVHRWLYSHHNRALHSFSFRNGEEKEGISGIMLVHASSKFKSWFQIQSCKCHYSESFHSCHLQIEPTQVGITKSLHRSVPDCLLNLISSHSLFCPLDKR